METKTSLASWSLASFNIFSKKRIKMYSTDELNCESLGLVIWSTLEWGRAIAAFLVCLVLFFIHCNIQNLSHFSILWLSLPLHIQGSRQDWVSAVAGVWRWYLLSLLQIIDWLPVMHCMLSAPNRDANQGCPLVGWLTATVNVHHWLRNGNRSSLQSSWMGCFQESSWCHGYPQEDKRTGLLPLLGTCDSIFYFVLTI